MPADGVVGAILGDLVGSVHESRWRKVPDRQFPFLTEESRFTDDTVLTIAVAEAVRLNVDFAEPNYGATCPELQAFACDS